MYFFAYIQSNLHVAIRNQRTHRLLSLRHTGALGLTCNLLMILQRSLLVILASPAECERHFSAFNARHIITGQRNMMFPETVQAISIVFEGHKNKLLT